MNSRFLDNTTPPHIVTLILVSGAGALTMNIFLPSLPSMADYFRADYAVVQLALSAYLASTAIVQLFIGPLSDRYGRRPVILVALAVFLVSTVVCFLTTNIWIFLVFRIIQATIASGFALSRAIVRDMVPTEQAASMIGYVTMGMALVPMIGPLIGGYLEEAYSWHASFYFLFVFGLIVFLAIYLDLGETNQDRSSSFSEQFRTYPELLRSRRFWGYSFTAAFGSGAFFAFLGGGPWVATNVLGLSPSRLGQYFMFVAGGYMFGNFLSGRYSTSLGTNRMMVLGSIVASAGMLLSIILFELGYLYPLSFFGPMFFVGVGNGLVLPNANAGMVSVRPRLAGSASGLGGAMMIGGGAGLSVFAGYLLEPGSNGMPLLILMFSSVFAGILSALYVIYIDRLVSASE